MYEVAKIVMWGLIAFAVICVLLFGGQLIETKNPGNAVLFDIAGYCLIGALALCIACAIYDAGIKAAREDQEIPPELLDKKE